MQGGGTGVGVYAATTRAVASARLASCLASSPIAQKTIPRMLTMTGKRTASTPRHPPTAIQPQFRDTPVFLVTEVDRSCSGGLLTVCNPHRRRKLGRVNDGPPPLSAVPREQTPVASTGKRRGNKIEQEARCASCSCPCRYGRPKASDPCAATPPGQRRSHQQRFPPRGDRGDGLPGAPSRRQDLFRRCAGGGGPAASGGPWCPLAA